MNYSIIASILAISIATGCGGTNTVVTKASGGSGGTETSGTCQSDAQCLNGYTCAAGVCVTNPDNTGGAGKGNSGTGGTATTIAAGGVGGTTSTATGGSTSVTPANSGGTLSSGGSSSTGGVSTTNTGGGTSAFGVGGSGPAGTGGSTNVDQANAGGTADSGGNSSSLSGAASTGGSTVTAGGANSSGGVTTVSSGPSIGGSSGGSSSTNTASVCSQAPSGAVCSLIGDYYCGSNICCPSTSPYFCPTTNSCYATAELATADCGSNCFACAASNSVSSGMCARADIPSNLSCAAGSLLCSSEACCPSSSPYACVATGKCYATAAAAAAACEPSATNCYACGTTSTSSSPGYASPSFVADICANPTNGMCQESGYAYSNGFLVGITLYFYVNNVGADGSITVTSTAGTYSETTTFTVKAGLRYILEPYIPIVAASGYNFVYSSSLPGTPGLALTTNFTGYDIAGAPVTALVEDTVTASGGGGGSGGAAPGGGSQGVGGSSAAGGT